MKKIVNERSLLVKYWYIVFILSLFFIISNSKIIAGIYIPNNIDASASEITLLIVGQIILVTKIAVICTKKYPIKYANNAFLYICLYTKPIIIIFIVAITAVAIFPLLNIFVANILVKNIPIILITNCFLLILSFSLLKDK